MLEMDESRIPVLVGFGQLTDRQTMDEAATPIDLMASAAHLAAEDTGVGGSLLAQLDTLVAVGLTVDEPNSGSQLGGSIRNVPLTLSRRLGIDPHDRYYTDTGGNTPQKIVNLSAERISRGETNSVLIAGAEALDTMIRRLKAGLELDSWSDDAGSDPEIIGNPRAPATVHERLYGLNMPSTIYPMFENALRGKYGLSITEHREHLGELYGGFNAVAAENPLSWFPTARSAQEIAFETASNRMVGFPYTKYLNSVIRVNMGGALIMTSVAEARRMGVGEDRWVYLHGCGDAYDAWYLHERRDYCSSPAIRAIGQHALKMADRTIDDIDFFDIYSCFPSAVQIACDELGIPHDDPRGLTMTGGLPYFGGPGNNYVTHSIGTMMQTLRSNPGKWGLVNANGWFVTKHSIGIYSTTPPDKPWQREDPQSYAQEPLDFAAPAFTEQPEGAATVETYTVLHDRSGPSRGIVIGRLADGTRFVADTPADPDTLAAMQDNEMLGRSGLVSQVEGRNVYVPDFSYQIS